jgi:hypothetical protein
MSRAGDSFIGKLRYYNLILLRELEKKESS